MKAWFASALAVLVLAFTVTVTAEEDSLSVARDLYAAAAYEEALVVLNKLLTASPGDDEGSAIEQYRAFCLLALGRPADAQLAIEAVVNARPSYQPSDAEVSPRVRLAFSEVRRRMLPAIIQQKYASAKAAFDRKEFSAAERGFQQVLDVLTDSDVGAAASQPPLADLRTLAAGFLELSAAAAAPPPPAPVAAAPLAPPAPPQAPLPPRIYGSEDASVVPPVTIEQVLPPFTFATATTLMQGNIEVVIDERGVVESALMRRSIYPRYDTMVVEAARKWQYKPATLNGVPVKYMKLVAVTVKR